MYVSTDIKYKEHCYTMPANFLEPLQKETIRVTSSNLFLLVLDFMRTVYKTTQEEVNHSPSKII